MKRVKFRDLWRREANGSKGPVSLLLVNLDGLALLAHGRDVVAILGQECTELGIFLGDCILKSWSSIVVPVVIKVKDLPG